MSEQLERFYTGVGSQQTPPEVAPLIGFVALYLNRANFTLRSGAADGADTMFERHAFRSEIYLPWQLFNRHASPLWPASLDASKIAAGLHAEWATMSTGKRKLHARNVHQVLGQNLATPSEFVVCWTPRGQTVGGTATAIKLAERSGIPVINLYHYSPLLLPLLEVRLHMLVHERR